MSYFNKKEEVIQIELTQYGKHLLSKGKFVPTYYSFFDDDVTYDWQYTGDAAELQNYAQDRILEETPSTKVQYVFSGRETIITQINDEIRNNRAKLRGKKVQQTPEKHYALSAPLGNSSFSTNFAPSWSAAALRGKFATSVRYQQGAQPTLMIPQIEVDNVVCKSVIRSDTPPDIESNSETSVFTAGEAGDVGSSGELQLATQQYDDGSYIHVASDHVVLEIDEYNTECLKENFDIEVFMVEEVDMTGKVKTPGIASDKQNKIERLIPLKFGKRFSNIINGILTDDVAPPPIYNYDPTFVEHYLDIKVDRDIDTEVLCSAGVQPSKRKCGGLDAGFLGCEEATVSENIGLYNKNSEGPYGEDC